MNTRELLMPHNLEAEQSTLGSMLLEKEALLKGLEFLKANDFYRPAHIIVFEAVLNLEQKSEPVDLITITNELKNKNKLDDCGGAEYLFALTESVPTAASIEYYAKIVKDYSTRRKIIAESSKMNALACDMSTENISDIFLQTATNIKLNETTSQNNNKCEFSISEILNMSFPDMEKLKLAGQPIIVKGWTHIFSASPKTGKTEITIRSALTWNSEKILFVTEEGQIVWQSRLKQLGLPHDINNISFLIPGMMSQSDILARIKKSNATVVIVDTLRSILRLKDENSSSECTRDIMPLTQLCKDAGKTLIVLHHSKKSFDNGGEEISRSSGSYAIVGLFDKVLTMSGTPEKLKLSATGRLEHPFECYLQWNSETNNIESLDPDANKKIQILEYLESINSDAKPMDIAEATGINKNTVYELLHKMANDGYLKQIPKPGAKGFTYTAISSFPSVPTGNTGNQENNLNDISLFPPPYIGEEKRNNKVEINEGIPDTLTVIHAVPDDKEIKDSFTDSVCVDNLLGSSSNQEVESSGFAFNDDIPPDDFDEDTADSVSDDSNYNTANTICINCGKAITASYVNGNWEVYCECGFYGKKK